MNEQGLVDLRIGEEQSYLGRVNRYLLIERLKKLERMGLAREEEPARWSLSSGVEKTLRELGERGDIIKTMHRALTEQGIAHAANDYTIHRGRLEHGADRRPPGREGAAGRPARGPDASRHRRRRRAGALRRDRRCRPGRRGEDRQHHRGWPGQDRASPRRPEHPRPHRARRIAFIARASISPASETITFSRKATRHGYVEAHVRRLEALRRAEIVERIDADHWHVPEDYAQRAQDYDAKRSRQLAVRVLSIIDLDAQVTANAATWLDRDLIAETPVPIARRRLWPRGSRCAGTPPAMACRAGPRKDGRKHDHLSARHARDVDAA